MKTNQLFPVRRDGSQPLHALLRIERTGEVIRAVSLTLGELLDDIAFELEEYPTTEKAFLQIDSYPVVRWDRTLANLYLADRSLSAEQVFVQMLTATRQTA